MCRLHEEMSRKVYSIDLTVLIPRKLYRKLSPILLIFAQGNFSFGVVYAQVHVHTCEHVHVYVHVCGYAQVHVHTCEHVHVYVHVCGYAQVHVHTCEHVHVYVYGCWTWCMRNLVVKVILFLGVLSAGI